MVETSKTQLGKYELILPPVGEGSEGLLYKARCTEEGGPGVRSGEWVALKRLRHIGRELRPDRFQRQAELLRKLRHPNIVSYKDTFIWRDEESDESHEVYCLVTEWLEGQSLKSLIEQHSGGVPWELAEGILRQVLQALAYAATERVVHRDLKPSNIYLVHEADETRVKLIDFGIARPMDAEATTTSTTVSFEGTWHWMAPDFVRLQEESFRGDERSDIYSFGVCFYQVLTGKFPYGPISDNPQFAYFQRWLAPTPPKMMLYPNLNALKGARSCIQKCLEVDRDKRYQTFEELLEAFSKIKYRQLRHAPEVYEYRRYLGQGGFGQVFRGCRLSDGCDVAIKELVAGQHARRFIREAKILQKAPHPHLVQYLDFVEVQASHPGEDPRYFLVLEYLEGMPGASLRDRIKHAAAGVDPREALVLFQGYLDCLEHLHQHADRIIHRDIKPGNLYAPAGAPHKGKLFDLGIAHDEEGTRTHGQVPGTLDYMPPEFGNSDSGRGSPQSDIYSLAVTLYEALTRALPLPRLPPGEKAWVEYIARSLQPVECSFEHRVFVEHPELVPLLRTALAHDPTQRFASAKAMRDEIQKIIEAWDRVTAACDAAVTAARAAFEKDDLEQTELKAREALDIKAHDLQAEELLAKVRERRLELYRQAFHSAQTAWENRNDSEAQRQAELALKFQPGDASAALLLTQVQQHKQNEYQTALTLARAALDQTQYSEAQRQAGLALAIRPNDLAASELLESARAAQKRLQENARPKPGPIQISLEIPTGERNIPILDELATASTARSVAGVPPSNAPPTSAHQDTRRSSTAPSVDKVIQREPKRAQGGPRRRIWVPVMTAAAAGVGLLGWLAFRPSPVKQGDSAQRTTVSQTAAQTTPGVDLNDTKAVRNLVTELAVKPVIQSDPTLSNALKALPASEPLTARDLTGLQTTLTQWWTNRAAFSPTLASLPSSAALEKQVYKELFGSPFPGLSQALQHLEEARGARHATTTNLARVAQHWQEFARRLSSAPEAAVWREYSSVSNLVPRVAARDLETQLSAALTEGDDPWTTRLYVRAYDAAQADVLGKWSAHFYQPPEKLNQLRKAKDDPALSNDARQYARLALVTEVGALEEIAQGRSPDSFLSWKRRLEENYTPLADAQLAELPPPSDIQWVEANLNDAARTWKGAPGQPVKATPQTLRTNLASLRQQVETVRRASEMGLLSRDKFAEESGRLGSELRSIQNAINALQTPVTSRSNPTSP